MSKRSSLICRRFSFATLVLLLISRSAMTQGRGSFSMEMDHYDFVPALQQEKIIAAAKAERGEEVEVEE